MRGRTSGVELPGSGRIAFRKLGTELALTARSKHAMAPSAAACFGRHDDRVETTDRRRSALDFDEST
jgi:hypothetical protein